MDLELGQRFKLQHSSIATWHERTYSIKAQQSFGINYQSVCVCTNITMYNLGHIAKHISRDAFYNHCIPWTPYNHCNPWTPYNHCIPWNPQRHKKNAYETFYHGCDMHNTTQTKYTTQEWEANMKNMYSRYHTTKTNKTHSSDSTKFSQTIFNIIFSKLNKKTIQEIKG